MVLPQWTSICAGGLVQRRRGPRRQQQERLMNTQSRGHTRLLASLALAIGLLGLSGCVAYPVGGYYDGGYYAPGGYAYAPLPGVYVGGGYGYYHRGWHRHWR
jgi:hypothetical protein